MNPPLILPRHMAKLPVGLAYDVQLVDARGRLIDSERGTLNLIPIEGLTHALGVLLEGVTAITTWYVSIFEGNYTPANTVTAATYPGLATECTTYAETTRQEYIGSAVSGGANNNNANLATFTSNADKTIYGAALVGAPGKGATSSVILSAVRFTSPKAFANGSKLYINASPAIASV